MKRMVFLHTQTEKKKEENEGENEKKGYIGHRERRRGNKKENGENLFRVLHTDRGENNRRKKDKKI